MICESGSIFKMLRKIFKLIYYLFIGFLLLILVLVSGEIVSGRIATYNAEYRGTSFIEHGNDYVSINPGMIKMSFKKAKPKNEFRIFVIGSSQAMGSPYVHQGFSQVISLFGMISLPNEGGISTWLEQYFAVIMPGKKCRVINAALGGRSVAEHQEVYREAVSIGCPDLMIVLTGNNERTISDKSLRLFDPPADQVKIIKNNFSGIMRELTDNYTCGIKNIASLAEKNKVETYFLTVPSNMNGWAPADIADFDITRTEELLSKGEYNSALKIVNKGFDEHNSLRQYYKGKCLEGLKDYPAALKCYYEARENDKSFLRCRESWNNIVRSGGGKYVKIIDMENILPHYAEHGILGSGLFHDYCHFNLKGNKITALEICKYYIRGHSLPESCVKTAENVHLTGWSKRQKIILYTIKMIKWAKMEMYAKITRMQTSQAMSRQIKEDFERSIKDVMDVKTSEDLIKSGV